MKTLLPAVVCLILGGAAGYFLGRSSGRGAPVVTVEKQVSVATSSAAAGKSGEQGSAAESASAALPTNGSLTSRMEGLLTGWDRTRAKDAVSSLSAADVQSALAYLASRPKSKSRDSLRMMLYRRWAALEPATAWKAVIADPLGIDSNLSAMLELMAASMPSNQMQGVMSPASVVAAEWAKTNPEAAMQAILAMGTTGRYRSNVMMSMIMEWGKHDLGAAISYLNAHPDLPMDQGGIIMSLASVAAIDPQKAASMSLMLSKPEARNGALTTVAQTWAQTDPDAAMRWAQQIRDPAQQQSAIQGVLSGWAEKNPRDAVAFAAQMTESEARTSAISSAFRSWMMSDPVAALEYYGAQSNDEKFLESAGWSVSNSLGTLTVKEQNTLLRRLPEGNAKERVGASLVQQRIGSGQYSDAVEVLNAMPDSTQRDGNLLTLGRSWANSDSGAAAAWLKAQPESSDRDLTVAGFIQTLSKSDPASAIAWADSIQDDQARIATLKNIAAAWKAVDANAANAWAVSVTEFTDADRDYVQKMKAGERVKVEVARRR